MAEAAFDSLLTHICTIKRRSTTTTAIGRWGDATETIATLSSNVSCLIQQRNEDVEFTRRGAKLISRHIAFFKIDAGILEDDVVVFNGHEYSVVSVSDAAGQAHHLECGLVSLEN
jgi:hypothetical protein